MNSCLQTQCALNQTEVDGQGGIISVTLSAELLACYRAKLQLVLQAVCVQVMAAADTYLGFCSCTACGDYI